MKKLFFISAIIFSTTSLLVSCEKEEDYLAVPQSISPDKAYVKFNYTVSYAANPSVQLELNKVRVSSLIQSRTPFPGGGYNTNGSNYPDYLVTQAGTNLLQIGIPYKNTSTDSVVILSKNIDLSSGVRQTVHIADTAANMKLFLVTDEITQPDKGLAKFRFINLMPNLANVDLYYGTTLVASNVAYGAITASFTLPIPSTANPLQTWAIRKAGDPASSTALATYNSSNTVLNQKVYTVFAQGYNGATDAVRKPYVSFLLNY